MSDCALSGAAIVIALFGLAVSAWVAYRDRGTVTATARYLDSYQHMSDGVYIHIVNSGRRPVTVRRIVVTRVGGEDLTIPLRPDKASVRLLESEDHELQLNAQDFELDQWVSKPWADAKVEDSHGKKYKVSGLVEAINSNLENLRAAL